MRKDISIIRESIGKVVTLLTKRSIKVTQRGSKAYVEYNAKTGAIRFVNLPYLPDDASDEFIAAVQGFLDHEVGHVLFTDPKIMPELRRESAKVKNLANAIEDVYIERKMTEAFSGSSTHLNSVRNFHLNKVSKPNIDQALAEGDMNKALAYAGLVQFRAWGGQKPAQDFLDSNPAYAELTKVLADRLGPELIGRIKKANSSWDVLALARAMKEKLEPPKPETPPAGSESSDEAGDPSGDGDLSTDPSDDTPPNDEDTAPPEGDAEDEGTVSAETDDSELERDETSEAEVDGEPEAGEDGAGDGSTDDRASSDDDHEGDHEDDHSEDAPEESRGGDDQDEIEGDPLTPEELERDPAEDQQEEGAPGSSAGESDDPVEEGETPSETGTGSGQPEAEEEAPAEDGKGGETTEEATPESGDATESLEDDEPDLSAAFDGEGSDFDDEVSSKLTEMAVKEIRDSDYQIFSTDWDEIEPAPKALDERSVTKMMDRTEHMIASIQKGLERAIAAKSRKTWNPAQRRGRISPGALFKTAVGDDRVFRTRYETQAKNTAVSLLVDCSGSMGWGGKIEVAGLAAYALSATLERLKINHEVLGFTTRVSRAMRSAMGEEGLGVRYAREEALYIPIFKSFSERLGVDAKSRIAHLGESAAHHWLRENVDGESLQIAARRLKSQRAERHLLIVLSDGSPACSGDYMQLCSHLKKVAKQLDTEGGVEVIGIGIQDSSVREYYSKNLVLNDVSELPTTVVSQLAKVLLAP